MAFTMPDREFLQISPRIHVLPIVHGSGDCALEVRRAMLERKFDCLAVPLPESFQSSVEAGIGWLPSISIVTQKEYADLSHDWQPGDPVPRPTAASYVPIDPCQGVIAGIRLAMEERIPRKYIDCETAVWQPYQSVLPDPYALKQVRLARFAAAILPSIPRPQSRQMVHRVRIMARRLRRLEQKYESILLVCSLAEWPWIHEACLRRLKSAGQNEEVADAELYACDPKTLLFVLGELPFITGLYEKARQDLDDDENLSIDGVKELLRAAREEYRRDFKNRGRKITPHLLAQYLKYARNLSLIERRLTPDLYTLVVAAQQIAGDQFAISVAEAARSYPFLNERPEFLTLTAGIHKGRFPDGTVLDLKSRLPGPVIQWRSCQLKPKPERKKQDEWRMRWNPYSQCSWPPEDELIERFRTHVKDKALSILGTDLARTEKFTTSLMDGLDIRETLRNWHTGDLMVKVNPPTRGQLDCVVMLFDYPADPRHYPWRTTWHAEHEEESTLGFFATDFRAELVGPGIGLATYGGCMFLFPPRHVPDIWNDPRLDFATTVEERVLAAGCLHSDHRHIAVLSEAAPGPGWRRMARRFGKKLIHVPLGHFSQAAVQQLRLVHVLNGREVRSYAADFIRRA